MGYRDMDLDDEVRASLRRNGELGARGVDVAVRNGIVYLKGSVPRSSHDRVVRLARDIESVAAVVDQLSET